MLVKYSCADLNTEDVRAGERQRDQISKACLDPGEDAAGRGGEGVWREWRPAHAGSTPTTRPRVQRGSWDGSFAHSGPLIPQLE